MKTYVVSYVSVQSVISKAQEWRPRQNLVNRSEAIIMSVLHSLLNRTVNPLTEIGQLRWGRIHVQGWDAVLLMISTRALVSAEATLNFL